MYKSIKFFSSNFPRPPKPKNRDAIVEWYKTNEYSEHSGFEPLADKPAIWFHGIAIYL